jgi:hypothetical protein
MESGARSARSPGQRGAGRLGEHNLARTIAGITKFGMVAVHRFTFLTIGTWRSLASVGLERCSHGEQPFRRASCIRTPSGSFPRGCSAHGRADTEVRPMFSMRIWDSFGSRGVSCVKLPAAVAFPTDGRLLQRIEESRRALPATNNMKPLWKSRGPGCSPVSPAPCDGGVGRPSIISVSLAAVDRLPARAEPRSIASQPVHLVGVTREVESALPSQDASKCVVALARAAGSMARALEGISVSAA